jgi:NAD(P)H-dependent flavin oxidoreductase YrpB (nitropropane dioxygenase family)
VQIGTRFMATAESAMNRWGVETLLTMHETETVVTKAMTGATVRCIATPELLAYEKAREAGAPETELNALMRAARGGKTRNDPEARRQYAAGQVAGMIRDVPTAADLIERIVREAAALAETLPEIARR